MDDLRPAFHFNSPKPSTRLFEVSWGQSPKKRTARSSSVTSTLRGISPGRDGTDRAFDLLVEYVRAKRARGRSDLEISRRIQAIQATTPAYLHSAFIRAEYECQLVFPPLPSLSSSASSFVSTSTLDSPSRTSSSSSIHSYATPSRSRQSHTSISSFETIKTPRTPPLPIASIAPNDLCTPKAKGRSDSFWSSGTPSLSFTKSSSSCEEPITPPSPATITGVGGLKAEVGPIRRSSFRLPKDEASEDEDVFGPRTSTPSSFSSSRMIPNRPHPFAYQARIEAADRLRARTPSLSHRAKKDSIDLKMLSLFPTPPSHIPSLDASSVTTLHVSDEETSSSIYGSRDQPVKSGLVDNRPMDREVKRAKRTSSLSCLQERISRRRSAWSWRGEGEDNGILDEGTEGIDTLELGPALSFSESGNHTGKDLWTCGTQPPLYSPAGIVRDEYLRGIAL